MKVWEWQTSTVCAQPRAMAGKSRIACRGHGVGTLRDGSMLDDGVLEFCEFVAGQTANDEIQS